MVLIALFLGACYGFVVRRARLSPDSFQHDLIQSHNAYRAKYKAPSLSWNETAAANARNWAMMCSYTHQANTGYGENLMWGGIESWNAVTNGWGQEESMYRYDSPGFSVATGHFTQLVWKKTQSVGCAWNTCPNDIIYVVCEYWPAGNIDGEYSENVGYAQACLA